MLDVRGREREAVNYICLLSHAQASTDQFDYALIAGIDVVIVHRPTATLNYYQGLSLIRFSMVQRNASYAV